MSKITLTTKIYQKRFWWNFKEFPFAHYRFEEKTFCRFQRNKNCLLRIFCFASKNTFFALFRIGKICKRKKISSRGNITQNACDQSSPDTWSILHDFQTSHFEHDAVKCRLLDHEVLSPRSKARIQRYRVVLRNTTWYYWQYGSNYMTRGDRILREQWQAADWGRRNTFSLLLLLLTSIAVSLILSALPGSPGADKHSYPGLWSEPLIRQKGYYHRKTSVWRWGRVLTYSRKGEEVGV